MGKTRGWPLVPSIGTATAIPFCGRDLARVKYGFVRAVMSVNPCCDAGEIASPRNKSDIALEVEHVGSHWHWHTAAA